MALDASKVRVAVTGAVYRNALGTTAPTGTSSALTSWDDLGYVSEDGVVIAFPDSGDVQNIKAWQGGATVRTVRSTSDDLPTIQVTFIETKLEVIEAVFGVTVTQTSTEGQFDIDTNKTRTPDSYVIDVVDGSELIRAYVPRGTVTGIGEVQLVSTDAIGYQVTIECERGADFNIRTWMTALKSSS